MKGVKTVDIKLTLENKQLYPSCINLRQFSNNTDIIKFEMPEYMYETTDLSTMDCYAVCDMGGNIDEVKLETEVVENKLRITWRVTGYTTQQNGHINYLIAFKDIENEESVLWFSYQGIIFVNSSINADDYIAAKYPSILQQWEERMNAVDDSNNEKFSELMKDMTSKVESGFFDGKTILYGDGIPSPTIGKENDTYINTSTNGVYSCFLFTKDDYSKGELDWRPRWTTRGVSSDTLPLQGIIFIPEEQKIHPGYEEAKDFHIPSEWRGLKAVQKTSEIHTLDGVVIDSLDSNSSKDAPSIRTVNEALRGMSGALIVKNVIPNNDFNTMIDIGIHIITEQLIEHAPEGESEITGTLTVTNNGDEENLIIYQTYESADNFIYLRSFVNGDWTEWKRNVTKEEYDRLKLSKQNKVLFGTIPPTDDIGEDGDIYIQIED